MADQPTYARANKIFDRTCKQYGMDPIEMRMAVVRRLHESHRERILAERTTTEPVTVQ